LFGIPLGCFLAFKTHVGQAGLLIGFYSATSLQFLAFMWLLFKFDWQQRFTITRAQVQAAEPALSEEHLLVQKSIT